MCVVGVWEYSSSRRTARFVTMAFRGKKGVQKVMVQPINLIFRFLQNVRRTSPLRLAERILAYSSIEQV